MWIDRLGQDLRYAFRTMRTSPGFTAAAVLVLAIGIGATVAAFSAFNIVALRPLPVRDPETILRFGRHAPESLRVRRFPIPPSRSIANTRARSRPCSRMTASRLSVDGVEPATDRVLRDRRTIFDELGARARYGRLFHVGDERPDAPPAVVLGHGFWSQPLRIGPFRRRHVRAAQRQGRHHHRRRRARVLWSRAATTPAFWALLDHHEYFVHGSQVLTDFSGQNGGVGMWGRLGPGSSPKMAEDELATLAAELRRQHPKDIWEGERLLSQPGGYAELIGAASVFALVGALVLLILAVACGNLGSLLLARGASRQREMALRSAIGAGTGRLIRQLFTESLVLALMGCLAGLALGSLVLKGILVWSEAPSWLDPTPDWRVVTFAIAMGFLSSVLFGLTPALHIARQKNLNKRTTFGRGVLIGAQVASSCVLLIVAGLLTRAFDRAASTDPGYEYEHVIVVEPSLIEHGYTAARARDYIQNLSARLRGIAGVEDVSVTSTPPLSGLRVLAPVQIDGRDARYLHPSGRSLITWRR